MPARTEPFEDGELVTCVFLGFDPKTRGSEPVWTVHHPPLRCHGTIMYSDSGPAPRATPVVAWVILNERRSTRTTIECGSLIWPGQNAGIIRDVLAGQNIRLTIRLRKRNDEAF